MEREKENSGAEKSEQWIMSTATASFSCLFKKVTKQVNDSPFIRLTSRLSGNTAAAEQYQNPIHGVFK